MGLLSSAIGAVAGLAGGALSASSARGIQQRQERYTERQMKNMHQWESEDLEKAGLNRALSGINSNAHAVGGAGGTGGQFDIAGSINQIANAKTLESQENLNDATATKTKVEAGVIEPTAKKNIEKMDSEIEQNNKKIELMESQKELNKAQKKYTDERARGYSESSSEQSGWNGEGSVDLGEWGGKKMGGKIGGGYNSAKSHSRTY